MHVSTRKTFGKSRRIERARRRLTSGSWSFNGGSAYYSPPVPYLTVELDGQDGKTYHIAFDVADIHSLNEALEEYKKKYPEYFGHQLVRRDPDKAL